MIAITVVDGTPTVSYLPLPHPSGLLADRQREVLQVASTRNPNEVYDLMPASGGAPGPAPLVPVGSRFLPGSLYLHDLGLIGGHLHANAVGRNAVVRLHDDGRHEPVWWPGCVEVGGRPRFDRNYIQLNSIAGGRTLSESYFSASADTMSARRPGHRNFAVDGRGVVFDGATREPMLRGLTRPHSARLHDGRLWVDNSGYGEVGFAEDGRLQTVRRLPGWTRGLCFHDSVAFVGTSRVIPRFRQYAPGLDPDAGVCGVHAVDVGSGAVLGTLAWPTGNQIFAVDWFPARLTAGFPFMAGSKRSPRRERELFYAFATPRREATNGTRSKLSTPPRGEDVGH